MFAYNHYSETIHEDYYPVYSYAAGSDRELRIRVMSIYSTDDYGILGSTQFMGSPYYYHWLINDDLRELVCVGIPCVNYQGVPYYSSGSGIISIGYFNGTYPYGFNNQGSPHLS